MNFNYYSAELGVAKKELEEAQTYYNEIFKEILESSDLKLTEKIRLIQETERIIIDNLIQHKFINYMLHSLSSHNKLIGVFNIFELIYKATNLTYEEVLNLLDNENDNELILTYLYNGYHLTIKELKEVFELFVSKGSLYYAAL